MSIITQDDLNAAYLAGIIDGEGCIGLHRKQARRYELCVEVKSTCPDLPEWIERHFGGKARPINDPRPLKDGNVRRSLSRWRAYGDAARKVLERIQPWLRVKATQARIGIEYQIQSLDHRRFSGPAYHAELMWNNGREARQRENGLAVTPAEVSPATDE